MVEGIFDIIELDKFEFIGGNDEQDYLYLFRCERYGKVNKVL